MSVRLGSFLLLAVMSAGASCGEPATNGPAASTPKTSRSMDKTEVTMEVSSSAPPEQAPPTLAPSAAATTGAAATSGPKDPSEDPMIGGPQEPAVEKAVAPARPRLRACYRKALAAEPNVSGAATFDATIGKDGHVSSARFVKREGLNEDMVGCLLAAMKSMTFEAGHKSQIVTLSFGNAPTAPSGAGGDAGVSKR